MKSLLLVTLFVSISVINCAFVSTNKAGSCPTPTGFGLCVQMCQSDINCPGEQKCCSNGCGYTCQNPVASLQLQPIISLPLQPVTGGSCPNTGGIIGICVIMPDHCYSDDECSTGMKCCPYGCGRKCLPVE